MPATKKLLIVPYQRFSASAKELARELRSQGQSVLTNVVKSTRPNNVVINWGCSELFQTPSRVLNRAESVRLATCKISTFSVLAEAGVQTPKWAIHKDIALQTLKFPIVCRTLTRASEGRGIVIADSAEALVNAPLYTEYKKKRAEYRIHVFGGEVLDVQQKRRRQGVQAESRVRNTANGWVFCRENVHVADAAKELAVRAVAALGLDFGAVDIIYNEHENQYYVLEVNTAPGIEGTTVKKYAEKIASIV